MLIEERHERILQILNDNKSIRAREIQELFGIGFDTARRDLRILEDKGLLKRTHGGAIPVYQVGFTTPKTYTPRDISDVKLNYLNIAIEAVKMIRPNDVVYITGASVGYFMVQRLPRDIEYTVVINSVILADELRKYDNISVFLLGGQMTRKGQIRDHFTLEMIKVLRFDKVFVTSAAFSSDFGMSIQSSNSVSVTQALIKSGRQAIGLFPHEKMGRESIMKICEPSELDIIITDEDTCTNIVEDIEAMNVEVIVVKER